MRRTPGELAAGENGIVLQDLRRRIRVQPVRKTIHFLVDASDSMLVEEQMKLAKGAVLGLLTQAYQKRYRVGVVVFHHWHAHEVLTPTTSITRARQALQAVATGGGTPLAEGLYTVLQVIRSESIRHPHDLPQLILVTDGKPSVSMNPKADMRQEVLDLASQFTRQHIPAIVLSTVEPGELLQELAAHLKAPLHKLKDVINSY
jgi:magnesium chelatase subunit D